MPVTRTAIRKGKTPEYKKAVMQAIHGAMLETVQIKDGDRFQTLTELDEAEFSYGPDFLGINRNDNLVQITSCKSRFTGHPARV